MTKKVVNQVITDKQWSPLAMGYLNLAEQGFLFLQRQPNIGRTRISNELRSYHLLEDASLIIASIWNIKHGLELVVKTLGTTLDKQYSLNHDLEFLFSELEKKIIQYSLKRDLNMLKGLVKKYSECNFSAKTKYRDKLNDYLRYPEITGTHLDWSFVNDLTRTDINQFLRDIHNTKRVYTLLEAEIAHFKLMYKLYKKEFDKKILSVQTIKKPGYKK